MIIAISGASGMVGARLVQRHLERGDIVRVLARRAIATLPASVRIFMVDLASGADVPDGFTDGADILYHCAAEVRDPARMAAMNVGGTRKLIAAARNRIGRWVQLGSIAVYGVPASGTITEESPLCPADVYGRSKAEADHLVIKAAEQDAFSCAVLRPAKIFGAGARGESNEILQRLISFVDKGLFFFIGKPGALTHYVHVDCVVDALVRCGSAAAARSAVYNLSDDCAIEDFIAVIADALGKPAPRLRLSETLARTLAAICGWVPGFPLTAQRVAALVNRAAFPCGRIARELDYSHPVRVQQGLRELVESWKRRA